MDDIKVGDVVVWYENPHSKRKIGEVFGIDGDKANIFCQNFVKYVHKWKCCVIILLLATWKEEFQAVFTRHVGDRKEKVNVGKRSI